MPKISDLDARANIFKKYTIRGLFDTDGSITDYRVKFLSIFPDLIEDVKSYYNPLGIKIRTAQLLEKKEKIRFKLDIPAEELKKFAQFVGFSHPRKQKSLAYFLSKNSLQKYFVGLNKDKMTRNYFNLNEFKVKNKSKVNIPLKPNNTIIKIAKHLRPVKNYGKLRFCKIYDKQLKTRLINSFEKIFNCKVSNQDGVLYANSKILESFFLNYF